MPDMNQKYSAKIIITTDVNSAASPITTVKCSLPRPRTRKEHINVQYSEKTIGSKNNGYTKLDSSKSFDVIVCMLLTNDRMTIKENNIKYLFFIGSITEELPVLKA